jgi:VanZ family protein
VFRALLLLTALIVYGCLYPFRFHALPPGGWDLFWHAWPARPDRFVVRDGLINLLMYMPFGALAYLVLDRTRKTWFRLLLPLLLAALLSTTIEFLQLMDYTRTSSVYDVVCNATGAAIGIAAAHRHGFSLFSVIRSQHTFTPTPGPAILVFYVWIAYQLFPLFPSIGLFAMRAKLAAFFSQPFSLSVAFLGLVEWLVLAAILHKILSATATPRWLLLFLLLLPARLFLLGRTLVPAELTGALLACGIWLYWLNRSPRSIFILSVLMAGALLVQELAPFRFSSTPQPFSWMPLAGFIETGPDWGAVVFLKKSFWYGAAVWLFAEAGAGYLWSTVGVALLLGFLEWVQCYLPGRTPEITDPVLAILLALPLYLFQQTSRSFARSPSELRK